MKEGLDSKWDEIGGKDLCVSSEQGTYELRTGSLGRNIVTGTRDEYQQRLDRWTNVLESKR